MLSLPEALVILAPNAYVLPSWYPVKAEHGRVVPTWICVAVHTYGPCSEVAGIVQAVRPRATGA